MELRSSDLSGRDTDWQRLEPTGLDMESLRYEMTWRGMAMHSGPTRWRSMDMRQRAEPPTSRRRDATLTNREAFNQYIRMVVERQITYMENMSDEELVQYCIDIPGYHIETNIGDKISYFKAMTSGVPVGPKDRVVAWFKEEAPEKIEWERML